MKKGIFVKLKKSNFKQDITMLNYYQEEFMFRHKNFSTALIKYFILNVVINLIPLCDSVFGIEFSDIPKCTKFIFPCIGIGVAISTFFILNDEAEKMTAVNKAKYRINKRLPAQYQYIFYTTDTSKRQSRFSFILTLITLLFELLISCFVIIVLALSFCH